MVGNLHGYHISMFVCVCVCVCMCASVCVQVDARNVDGSTPLCEACAAGSTECVQLLLGRGAKVIPDTTPPTTSPLWEACLRGERVCVCVCVCVCVSVCVCFNACFVCIC